MSLYSLFFIRNNFEVMDVEVLINIVIFRIREIREMGCLVNENNSMLRVLVYGKGRL